MNSTTLWEAAGGLVSVEPLSWNAIFACIASGAIIGCERQIQGKPMGARTSILICLGTYALVTAGLGIASDMSDPTRIVGQIITGIGFLGAGVMMTRDGAVVGVTSAASIWMLAAIGIIIATNPPLLGIKLAILSVIILVGLNYTETALRGLSGLAHRVLHPHMRGMESAPDKMPPGGDRRRAKGNAPEHE